MGRNTHELPTIWVESGAEYRPMGVPWDGPPDASVAGYARVQPRTPPGGGGAAQPPPVDVLAKTDGQIVVPGFVTQAQCQASVDQAVAAATVPEPRVLPEGYSVALAFNADGGISKVRLSVPGGRWVEYDPSDNTFRS